MTLQSDIEEGLDLESSQTVSICSRTLRGMRACIYGREFHNPGVLTATASNHDAEPTVAQRSRDKALGAMSQSELSGIPRASCAQPRRREVGIQAQGAPCF